MPGFEIILFYAALIGSGMYNTGPVFVGAMIGTLALIGVYFGLNKITKIIPVGMFFRASSSQGYAVWTDRSPSNRLPDSR